MFYQLFDVPLDRLIRPFAEELHQRDVAVAQSGSPFRCLSLPIRFRDIPQQSARRDVRQSRFLPWALLQSLTHNGQAPIKLHSLKGAEGFTLAEGLRDPDDPSFPLLAATRICTKAEARLFRLHASESLCEFVVTGPGSGLRLIRSWREDCSTDWRTEAKGEPQICESAPEGRLTKEGVTEILACLDAKLPDALTRRAFARTVEFKQSLRGQKVGDLLGDGRNDLGPK